MNQIDDWIDEPKYEYGSYKFGDLFLKDLVKSVRRFGRKATIPRQLYKRQIRDLENLSFRLYRCSDEVSTIVSGFNEYLEYTFIKFELEDIEFNKTNVKAYRCYSVFKNDLGFSSKCYHNEYDLSCYYEDYFSGLDYKVGWIMSTHNNPINKCMVEHCGKQFTYLNKRRHCRDCGIIFCCGNYKNIFNNAICKTCDENVRQKLIKHSQQNNSNNSISKILKDYDDNLNQSEFEKSHESDYSNISNLDSNSNDSTKRQQMVDKIPYFFRNYYGITSTYSNSFDNNSLYEYEKNSLEILSTNNGNVMPLTVVNLQNFEYLNSVNTPNTVKNSNNEIANVDNVVSKNEGSQNDDDKVNLNDISAKRNIQTDNIVKDVTHIKNVDNCENGDTYIQSNDNLSIKCTKSSIISKIAYVPPSIKHGLVYAKDRINNIIKIKNLSDNKIAVMIYENEFVLQANWTCIQGNVHLPVLGGVGLAISKHKPTFNTQCITIGKHSNYMKSKQIIIAQSPVYLTYYSIERDIRSNTFSYRLLQENEIVHAGTKKIIDKDFVNNYSHNQVISNDEFIKIKEWKE